MFDAGQAYARVSEVYPDRPETWDGRIFLTLDLDWAHDRVIEYAIEVVEAAGVPATWFVTHETPLLERLRGNSLFELGIHPNFNFLLGGDTRNGGSAEEVVDRILAIVPEAKAVRSHSLVQGGRLFELFRSRGLTHDCNGHLPAHSGMTLRPWTDWSRIIRVPYFWEDDFWFSTATLPPMTELIARAGIRAFDFHPIHLYLNTSRPEQYEEARADFGDPVALQSRRYSGQGAFTMLQELFARTLSASAERDDD